MVSHAIEINARFTFRLPFILSSLGKTRNIYFRPEEILENE